MGTGIYVIARFETDLIYPLIEYPRDQKFVSKADIN